MERSPVPVAELEGVGHVVRYVNLAFCKLAGKPKEVLVGKPFVDAMRGGDTCLAMLDRVYRTGEAETYTESEHPDRHPPYWSYAMWPVLDAEQRPIGVMMQVTETTLFHQQAGAMNEALLISSVQQHEYTEAAERLNDKLRAEIVERRRVEDELSESEARYRTLFDAIDEGFCIIEKVETGPGEPIDFRYLAANPAFGAQSGVADVVGKTIREAFPGEPEEWFTTYDAIVKTGESIRFERDLVTQRRVLELYAFRLEDEARRQVAVIFADITNRKRAEEHRQLLINELNHRVKNTLATVQSFASQTLRNAKNLAEARTTFESRIVALAKAHDVLTREHWEGASLEEIVANAMIAYLADERLPRFHAEGPDLRLHAKAALALSMALHELATNAVKYGALSNATGRVEAKWSFTEDEPSSFQFQWTETGGPPVERPRRRGFGSRLIEQGLAQELAGEVRLSFATNGLVCIIEAPLAEVKGEARF
jgi:PAS domain S-box-containing protein